MAYIGSTWEYSNLIVKGALNAWYAADADDSGAALTDLSGNGRHLAASATAPTRNATAAPNDMPAIVWDGSAQPLATSSSSLLNSKTVWILASFTGSSFSEYQGLVTGKNNSTDGDLVLLSQNSGTKFFQNTSITHDYYKNGVSFALSNLQAPVGGAWGLIEITDDYGWDMTGIQLGQDRTFTGRKFTGKIAEALFFNKQLNAAERLGVIRYFAGKYQTFQETAAGLKIFPFPADWAAPFTADKSVLFSRSISGAVKQRVRIAAEKLTLEARYSIRRPAELDAAQAFWSEHYGSKSFIFRNYGFDPARDLEAYFASPIDYQADAYQNIGYGFSIVEK